MSYWYDVASKCVNVWSLLAIVVISITIIICKWLSTKRDKQFLDFVSSETNQSIHMSITEGDAHYEFDTK